MLNTLLLALLPAVTADAPRGTYVEARTAAVFAGACHYGAQYTTQGREAVLGWRVEAGGHDGVSLVGLDLVVVLAADVNLDEDEACVRSVVYVDGRESAERRAAALAWLRARHGARVGTILSVEEAPVRVAREGERFELAAGEAVALSGEALPDRACCTMPLSVWYEPLAPVQGRIVGRTEAFAVRQDALGRRWSRPDENAVFLASFGTAP